MSAALYSINSLGDEALAAATAETLLNAIAEASSILTLVTWSVSFDGVSLTAEPVTIEIGKSTQATAGTSTAQTPNQDRGPTRAFQGTAADSYTAEPTVITVHHRILVHPAGGSILDRAPLGLEFEQSTTADGIVMRATAPAVVNAQAFFQVFES